MAGLANPAGLAGSSLLPLVDGRGDPARKDFVTAQYHSVFSVTGEFMIRQGARAGRGSTQRDEAGQFWVRDWVFLWFPI
jgi:hypothetical protein